jgi:hypothetical protein
MTILRRPLSDAMIGFWQTAAKGEERQNRISIRKSAKPHSESPNLSSDTSP